MTAFVEDGTAITWRQVFVAKALEGFILSIRHRGSHLRYQRSIGATTLRRHFFRYNLAAMRHELLSGNPVDHTIQLDGLSSRTLVSPIVHSPAFWAIDPARGPLPSPIAGPTSGGESMVKVSPLLAFAPWN